MKDCWAEVQKGEKAFNQLILDEDYVIHPLRNMQNQDFFMRKLPRARYARIIKVCTITVSTPFEGTGPDADAPLKQPK